MLRLMSNDANYLKGRLIARASATGELTTLTSLLTGGVRDVLARI